MTTSSSLQSGSILESFGHATGEAVPMLSRWGMTFVSIAFNGANDVSMGNDIRINHVLRLRFSFAIGFGHRAVSQDLLCGQERMQRQQNAARIAFGVLLIHLHLESTSTWSPPRVHLQLHLKSTSTLSPPRLHLGHTLAPLRLHLCQTLAPPWLHLGCIFSWLHLGCTLAAPWPWHVCSNLQGLLTIFKSSWKRPMCCVHHCRHLCRHCCHCHHQPMTCVSLCLHFCVVVSVCDNLDLRRSFCVNMSIGIKMWTSMSLCLNCPHCCLQLHIFQQLGSVLLQCNFHASIISAPACSTFSFCWNWAKHLSMRGSTIKFSMCLVMNINAMSTCCAANKSCDSVLHQHSKCLLAWVLCSSWCRWSMSMHAIFNFWKCFALEWNMSEVFCIGLTPCWCVIEFVFTAKCAWTRKHPLLSLFLLHLQHQRVSQASVCKSKVPPSWVHWRRQDTEKVFVTIPFFRIWCLASQSFSTNIDSMHACWPIRSLHSVSVPHWTSFTREKFAPTPRHRCLARWHAPTESSLFLVCWSSSTNMWISASLLAGHTHPTMPSPFCKGHCDCYHKATEKPFLVCYLKLIFITKNDDAWFTKSINCRKSRSMDWSSCFCC